MGNAGAYLGSRYLYGAAAAPTGRAWAVGFYMSGTATLTLIERRNGASWQVVTSPIRYRPCGRIKFDGHHQAP